MSETNTPNKFHPQETDDDACDYAIKEVEIKMPDERRQNRLTGKGEIYSREEAKEIITGNKQSNNPQIL